MYGYTPAEDAIRARSGDSGGGGRPARTRLTDAERGIITRATELAALRGTPDVKARFGEWGDDTTASYAEAFGVARYLLTELIVIVKRLEEENS